MLLSRLFRDLFFVHPLDVDSRGSQLPWSHVSPMAIEAHDKPYQRAFLVPLPERRLNSGHLARLQSIAAVDELATQAQPDADPAAT
jgi:hypothetical protein